MSKATFIFVYKRLTSTTEVVVDAETKAEAEKIADKLVVKKDYDGRALVKVVDFGSRVQHINQVANGDFTAKISQAPKPKANKKVGK